MTLERGVRRLRAGGCGLLVFFAGHALGRLLACGESGVSQAVGRVAVSLGGAFVGSCGDWVGLVHVVYDTALFGDRDLGEDGAQEGVDS